MRISLINCFIMLYIVYIILFVQNLFAQEGYSISGIVYNEKHVPVESATIALQNSNIYRVTDDTGYFSIPVENEGQYIIEISYIGYDDLKFTLKTSNSKPEKITLLVRPINKEQVVITSNKKETNIKDTPIITHVIRREDLNKTSYSTFDELIEFAMPNIQSSHDNHGEDKIKIQGLDNKYTTFLINGNKVRGEFAGNIDFSQFNINNIERVEIIRGGLSTVYGSGAIGGVVNIITKDNPDVFWFGVNSFYDVPKIFSNSLEFGGKYKKISYGGNINYSQSDGYDLTPDEFGTASFSINKTLDGYDSFSLNQSLAFTPSSTSHLKINYKYYLKNIYKYQFISNDNKTYLQDALPVFSSNTFEILYSKNLAVDSKVSLNYQSEKYLKSFYLPYYYEQNNSYSINGDTFLWSSPSTSTFSILYSSIINNHSIVTGLDYVYQSYLSSNIFSSNDLDIIVESIFAEDATKKMSEISFFLLDNFIFKDIDVCLGARVNYHSVHKTRILPSISLMKTISYNTYRFNYSQNYRIPSLKEMYYKYEDHGAGFPVIGNENLNPSMSNYYSISFESRKYLNNSIEFYYNDLSNMIANKFVDDDGETVYKYINYKNVSLYGANMSVSLNLSDNLLITSIYTFTDGKINYEDASDNYQDVLDGISTHSMNFNLRYSFFQDWSALFSLKFNSSKTIDSSLEDEVNLRNELELPAYSILNISFTRSMKKGSYIKFGVKNILDYSDVNNKEGLEDFLSTYEPGRRFFINLNFNFSK